MRPVKLVIQAFNAYATEQTVDFTALQGHTLMMICGETGAGKTALLDAMAYALFGQSTGGERDESSIRSHHALDGVKTFVNFTFELGGELYRAYRMPPQDGKKTGLVEFWRVDGDQDDEGALIASGKRDVGKAVRALLGYDLDQFRSVVMLPQGRFREFLSANTTDKAKILSTLFSTHRYRRLQDELKERSNRLRAEQSATHERMAQCLQVAQVDTEAELETRFWPMNARVGVRHRCRGFRDDARAGTRARMRA